jgi:hypothetical protein
MKLYAGVIMTSTNDTNISPTKTPMQMREETENVSHAIKADGGDLRCHAARNVGARVETTLLIAQTAKGGAMRGCGCDPYRGIICDEHMSEE